MTMTGKNYQTRLIFGLLIMLSGALPGKAMAEPRSDGSTVRVAGIVLKWLRTKKAENYRRLEPMVREAARQGARIVCTTECFLDGYAIADKEIPLEEYRALGETVPGGVYYEKLSRLAKELDIYLIAGMLEADGIDRYNTAIFVGPDGDLIGKYRKQKLGHEKVRNRSGSESSVFRTPWGRVGIMICADRTEKRIVQRFCDNGADFLICPSGGMYGPERNDPILQARSKENQRYIVFVHPAEFLVTGPQGMIESRTILGDRLLISTQQQRKKEDLNRVFYYNLPLMKTSDSRDAHK